MYPTLYHFFYDVFGVEWPWAKLLNSFGFFVAVAFIVSSWLWAIELKRKEKQGFLFPEKRKMTVGEAVNWSDVIFNAVIGFIIGWKFIYLIANAGKLFTPGSMPAAHIFSLKGYWFWGIVMGALFGFWRWYDYNKKKLPKPEEHIVDFHPYQYAGSLTFVAAIGGMLGAKLFHLIENPREMVEFFTKFALDNFLSGLTVYGGLIFGSIVVLLYARRLKIPLLHLMDSAAPAMILGYGIGRIGCQVSGDGDWGIHNTDPKPNWLSWLPDWLWTYDYPNNVNGIGVPISDGPMYEGYATHLVPSVYPTPVYETLMTIVIFIILWRLARKINVAGVLFSIYLMLNGTERFFIEKIRVNNQFDFLGMTMTQAELIAVLFVIAGAVMYFVLNRKSTPATAPTDDGKS